MEGTLDERFRVRLLTDFGSGRVKVLDAFVEAGVVRGVAVRVGRFKGPVGLERLRSAARDLDFAERAFPTQLVPNREDGRATPAHAGAAVRWSSPSRTAW